MYLNVYSSTICNNQDIEETYMSTDKWTDKEDVIYILLSHKNKWNNAFYTIVDEPKDYHTKRSKQDKYHMLSLMSGI